MVDVFQASAGQPFPAAAVRLSSSAAPGAFGQVLIGNTYSGRPGSYATPFVGSPELADPDLVVAASLSGTDEPSPSPLPIVHVISGTRLLGWTGTVDLATAGAANVSFDLSRLPGAPAEWRGSLGSGIRDMDGDGFADFAISEFFPNPAPTPESPAIDGQIVVLY